MSVVVQKFGGTSLSDAEAFRRCADRVVAAHRAGRRLVVVVSAMGRVTDELISLASELAPSGRSPREMDLLLSTGEQASTALMALAIEQRGVPSIGLTGAQLGIRTTSGHQNARILGLDVHRLRTELNAGRIVVAAGFQGIDERGEVTTLGRGGSDITAVAITAALASDEPDSRCEIYTDVDGVYTADPSLVPGARRLERVDYEQMLELASCGASVVHPRAVELAWRHDLPVLVHNSRGDDPGTMLDGGGGAPLERAAILGCALTEDLARVRVTGDFEPAASAAELMHRLAEAELPVEEVRQTTSAAGAELMLIAAAADMSALREELTALDSLSSEVSVSTDVGLSRISVVGVGFRSHLGVGAGLFSRLADADIELRHAILTNRRISCFVDGEVGERCLRVSHDALRLSEPASGDAHCVAADDR